MLRVGIDIGGTFTDFALERSTSSKTDRWFLKVLTTPEAPEQAVMHGLERILAEAGHDFTDLDTVVHGTTLATNAVIERRGARTALITTEGFRDTLEMGTESRYDHYDLYVDKPEPLVPRDLRITLNERLAADGSVLRPLNPQELETQLPRLDAAGIEAVAVGFLHSYRNPVHELEVAQVLRRLRPHWHVSLSHEVAPEMREYERFATTCVNAYVQPVMHGYLQRLQDALLARGLRVPLWLMLSNGGLGEVEVAKRFPVRLLESGPAGGAILAADVARRLGIERALLLDIGGTTAKLCFIDNGTPQTTRTMEVARLARFKAGSGIPLRFPVVELAEIGAGGGSIAQTDDLGRLQVGPESAGSKPGPACYGLGGSQPTVTDAHLVLGRLRADQFAGGDMTLDSSRAHTALATLGQKLSLSIEDTAWSVCEIIDENMANAVHEHAVEVGKGLEGRVLIAIGGMAPLHAARLAKKLGLTQIVVPDGAGVGSALGFLRAPVAFETTRSVQTLISKLDPTEANTLLDDMSSAMRGVVRHAIPAESHLQEQCTAWMRYRGQGHEIRVFLPTLRLAEHSAQALRTTFEATYHELYGRIIADAPIEILGWTVRVEAPVVRVPSREHIANVAQASRTLTFYDQTARMSLEARTSTSRALPAQTRLTGPALLVESETTIVIPPACGATISASGDVCLNLEANANTAVASNGVPSEIRAQVLWSRLIAVVEEQARTLMRTAFSATVREAGDLSAGLFDLQGRLIAQAVTGTPGHVNSMAACAEHFLAKYPPHSLREGDHLITNDPWLTSGHLHDVTVLSPAFQDGRIIGFFACTCHQVDIGGLGQGPDGRSVYEEGLYLPILPLARAGVINEDLLAIVRANVRQPEPVIGDILSYVTANEVSARRLAETLDEFGVAGLEDIASFILNRSAAGMRAAIAALPQGAWSSTTRLDGYDEPVTIQCQVRIDGERVQVDFDGTSAASAKGINLVLNYTRAYAAFGIRAAVAPQVPNNAGSLALVEVNAPRGSILNVAHPAPVCARHIIGQFLPEVALAALAQAMPGRIPAEGAACNWGLQLRGHGGAEQPFEILFFNAGGSGARPQSDGLSATAFPSGIRAIPVEICEAAAPIVIWRKELRPDSGGAGRYRGGLGQRVEVGTRDQSAFQVFGIFDRVLHPARGRAGGLDGAPGWVGTATGKPMAAMGLQTIPSGEILRIDVPGGAGYGDPRQRSPQAVYRDIQLGYVSADSARAQYPSVAPQLSS